MKKHRTFPSDEAITVGELKALLGSFSDELPVLVLFEGCIPPLVSKWCPPRIANPGERGFETITEPVLLFDSGM